MRPSQGGLEARVPQTYGRQYHTINRATCYMFVYLPGAVQGGGALIFLKLHTPSRRNKFALDHDHADALPLAPLRRARCTTPPDADRGQRFVRLCETVTLVSGMSNVWCRVVVCEYSCTNGRTVLQLYSTDMYCTVLQLNE